jgi:hypothetical protein
MAGIFLRSRDTVRFSKRTLVHGICWLIGYLTTVYKYKLLSLHRVKTTLNVEKEGSEEVVVWQ